MILSMRRLICAFNIRLNVCPEYTFSLYAEYVYCDIQILNFDHGHCLSSTGHYKDEERHGDESIVDPQLITYAFRLQLKPGTSRSS